MPAKNEEKNAAAKNEGTGKMVAAAEKFASVIAVLLAVFQMYTACFGAFGALQQRTIHLVLVCLMVFILYPTSKEKGSWLRIVDVMFFFASAFIGVYLYLKADQFAITAVSLEAIDVAVGLLGIVIVFESTRRVMGWIMPSIAGVFMLYALFGQYMPDLVVHRGFTLERISYQMFFTMEGVLGAPLGVSATFVSVFVIFAAFLRTSGAGDFFINCAFALFGKYRGGPAKAAVIASSLFGTFSGSAIANVVGTGTFTIPLMKRTGYRPQFAAAVESVASTGGQLMPPVMGAAAFLMVEFINMSYTQIMLASILPAVLFYLAVFIMVDLEAGKNHITGLTKEELPSLVKEIKSGWIMVIPLIVLIVMLVYSGTTPSKAGFWSTIAVVAVAFINRSVKFAGKELWECLESGGKSVIEVATACATAGIIIGVITLTGLGMKLSNVLINLAGGNTFTLLMLTAIACTILGMGVPTTACYLIVATLVAPALVKMGVLPIAAHLFVFYYGVMSMITPPVALAAYAGASIAGANPFKTGFTAMRLGVLAFVIPFNFVYGPPLLLEGSVGEIVQSMVTATIGTAFLSVAIQGWFKVSLPMLSRLLLAAAGLCLIDTGMLTDILSIALAVGSAMVARFMPCKDDGGKVKESLVMEREEAK